MGLVSILITLLVAFVVAIVVKFLVDYLDPRFSGLAAIVAFLLVLLARFGVGL